MNNKNTDQYNEIKYMSESEILDMQNYINSYNNKLRKKEKFVASIINSIKYILYTPLSIVTNMLSILFKICGSILSIGIPYGIYCIYQIIIQLKQGVAFGEIKQVGFAYVFIIFPFIAFALSLVLEKISDYLKYNS